MNSKLLAMCFLLAASALAGPVVVDQATANAQNVAAIRALTKTMVARALPLTAHRHAHAIRQSRFFNSLENATCGEQQQAAYEATMNAACPTIKTLDALDDSPTGATFSQIKENIDAACGNAACVAAIDANPCMKKAGTNYYCKKNGGEYGAIAFQMMDLPERCEKLEREVRANMSDPTFKGDVVSRCNARAQCAGTWDRAGVQRCVFRPEPLLLETYCNNKGLIKQVVKELLPQQITQFGNDARILKVFADVINFQIDENCVSVGGKLCLGGQVANFNVTKFAVQDPMAVGSQYAQGDIAAWCTAGLSDPVVACQRALTLSKLTHELYVSKAAYVVCRLTSQYSYYCSSGDLTSLYLVIEQQKNFYQALCTQNADGQYCMAVWAAAVNDRTIVYKPTFGSNVSAGQCLTNYVTEARCPSYCQTPIAVMTNKWGCCWGTFQRFFRPTISTPPLPPVPTFAPPRTPYPPTPAPIIFDITLPPGFTFPPGLFPPTPVPTTADPTVLSSYDAGSGFLKYISVCPNMVSNTSDLFTRQCPIPVAAQAIAQALKVKISYRRIQSDYQLRLILQRSLITDLVNRLNIMESNIENPTFSENRGSTITIASHHGSHAFQQLAAETTTIFEFDIRGSSAEDTKKLSNDFAASAGSIDLAATKAAVDEYCPNTCTNDVNDVNGGVPANGAATTASTFVAIVLAAALLLLAF